MSDQSAIRLLQTAIENVRSQCTGPEYKTLLAALDVADSAAEKALGEPDDSAQDKQEETQRQARTLQEATVNARKQFAKARAAAADNKPTPGKSATA